MKPTAALRGLLFAVCLGLTPWLAAQDDLAGGFSKPSEIQKRLAAAPALRGQYQVLEAVCEYHLATVDIPTR